MDRLAGRRPADTDEALAPLCLLEDYERASLLADILGEGQILDVFKIIHDLAPDEATRRIVLLARRDEARHVSYGSRPPQAPAPDRHRPRGGRTSDRRLGRRPD